LKPSNPSSFFIASSIDKCKSPIWGWMHRRVHQIRRGQLDC
jgi:hypothetical protein